MTDNIDFPYLLLLVSGGHCQILVVEGVGKYKKLGGTIDDSIGEAFDKTAKMLGLGYPGGPAVEKHAEKGNPDKFDLPRPLLGKAGCDFSFSGLKTAIYRIVEANKNKNITDDMCASFQKTAGEIVEDRMRNAIEVFKDKYGGKHMVIAGGVAANKYLRNIFHNLGGEYSLDVVTPPLKLCTDNAAMVAWAGIERLKLGLIDDVNAIPRARWPLEDIKSTA